MPFTYIYLPKETIGSPQGMNVGTNSIHGALQCLKRGMQDPGSDYGRQKRGVRRLLKDSRSRVAVSI